MKAKLSYCLSVLTFVIATAFSSNTYASNQCEIYIRTYSFMDGSSIQLVERNCNGTVNVLHKLETPATNDSLPLLQ